MRLNRTFAATILIIATAFIATCSSDQPGNQPGQPAIATDTPDRTNEDAISVAPTREPGQAGIAASSDESSARWEVVPERTVDASRILSIADSGAELGQGLGTLTDAQIDTPFSFAEIQQMGLDYYMDADGIPRGRGAEELLHVRVSTGLYSGMRHGNGDWVFFDQPVWAVAV